MNKIKILLLIIIIGFSLQSTAQTYRQGSCGGNSSSNFYITPYIGIGGGSYSYNLNNTVMDIDSTYYNNEKGSVFSPIAGINFMYKIGRGNLGGGAEYHGLFGETGNGLTTTKQSTFLLKFYGRFEYIIYTDAFNDFGVFFEGGLLFPNNAIGEYANMGANGKGGIFYNYIIGSTSSLYIGLNYEYAMFTTEIGSAVSNHKINNIELTIGYRFWFY